MLRTLPRTLQQLIAPPRCLGCLQEMTWLCRDCQPQIADHVLSCIICHRPQPRGLTCLHCRTQAHLNGLISVGSSHTPLIERGVQWLKFKGVKEIAPLLAQLLTFRLSAIASFEHLKHQAYFVPIPLHYRRERVRGFNHSQLLADALTSLLDIPTLPLLTRTRATWIQTKLPAELRHQNVINAFALAYEPAADRSIAILVDDITHTGATLTAAAQVLQQSPSAQQIWGATIGRG